jgi:transcription antitermination factor NusG
MWVALEVSVGKEYEVKEYVKDARVSGFDRIWLPTFKYEKLNQILRYRVLTGYLFLRVNHDKPIDTRRLIEIPYCNGILTIGDKCFITEKEIKKFKKGIVKMQKKDKVVNEVLEKKEFSEGDRVKIIDDMFGNMFGTVIKVNKKRQICKVYIKMFRRKVRMDFSFADIQKI